MQEEQQTLGENRQTQPKKMPTTGARDEITGLATALDTEFAQADR